MKEFSTYFGLMIVFIVSIFVCQFTATPAQAQSSFFTSQGCSGCHAVPVVATCNGCHAHGTHANSAKSGINVTGVTNKSSYSPGETVSVTVSGGYRTGWLRAVLYDQNQVELARSNGNASGMGSATTFPALLTAPAPVAAGTYTWKIAWYGNKFDAGGATFGAGWTADPSNPDHGQEIVSLAPFTVGAAVDSTPPVVNTFTLSATAATLAVPVIAFSASDNVAVTGYLITTSNLAPNAAMAGWSSTPPTAVTAPAAGSVTFYGWAKDVAGNVSLSKSATVVVTLADATAPVVNSFTLPASAATLAVPVSAFTASDNVAVTGYLITTSNLAPNGAMAGWSSTPPTTVTAPAAGSVTFYGWAKDAAGNVSLSLSATVVITLVTGVGNPLLTVSTLNDGDVTSKRTLNITGSATDPDGIQSVTLNGKKLKVKADGFFTAVFMLKPGSNTITIVVTDSNGNQSSDIRTITFDKKAPLLAVNEPADHLYTNESFIAVSGTIDETSIVTVAVNGGVAEYAAVDGNNFVATVYLLKGVNTLIIKAVDQGGNKSTVKRTVVYDDGSPNLEVINPKHDMTTKKPQLLLKGKVKGADVTVTITMGADTFTPAIVNGKFSQLLTFTTAGQYDITVTAMNTGGSSTVQRAVIYQPKMNEDDNMD